MNHKVQELDGVGSCMKQCEHLPPGFGKQQCVLRNSRRWKKKTGAKGQMFHLSPKEGEKMHTWDPNTIDATYVSSLLEKTRTGGFSCVCQDLRDQELSDGYFNTSSKSNILKKL